MHFLLSAPSPLAALQQYLFVENRPVELSMNNSKLSVIAQFVFVWGLIEGYYAFETLHPVRSFATSDDQAKAAQALLIRFIGNRTEDIDVVVDSIGQEYVTVKKHNPNSC